MNKATIVDKLQQLGYSQVSANKIYETASGFRNRHYPDVTLDELFTRPLSRIRKLTLIENPNTKRNVAKAFLMIRKVLDLPDFEKNLDYYKKVYNIAKIIRETKPNKQVDDSNNNTSDVPSNILYKLLTELPPRRAKDYRLLLLKKPKNPKEHNYYHNGFLHFNDFKTKKSMPSVMQSLPQQINELFIILKKDKKRKYLIGNKEPLTESTFSKHVKQNLGMTINDFRKLYIQKHINQQNVKQAMDIAKQMSHSVGTQQTDYN